MKIAIIGTHSTGKTTLIEKLKIAFEAQAKEVIVLSELARECPFPINEGTTLDAQKWILLNQITRENQTDHSDKIFITDRASIDNFAYMYRIGTHLNIDHFENEAVKHAGSYDFIFKTRKLDIDAADDGVRTTDGEFRDMMDRLIHLLLEKHSIDYHLLEETLSYDDHVRFIIEKVENNN